MELEGSDRWQGSREGRTQGTAARLAWAPFFSVSRYPRDNAVVCHGNLTSNPSNTVYWLDDLKQVT